MPIRWNKILIILFVLAVNVSFSQEKNPTVYPYGGMPDSGRFNKYWMNRNPLKFNQVDFKEAIFESIAEFGFAQFRNRADFYKTQFHSRADFRWAEFDSATDFREAQFDSIAHFGWTQFHDSFDITGIKFKNQSYFFHTQFDSMADFRAAQFYSMAHFGNAQFHSKVDFYNSTFDSSVFFSKANFHSQVDFRLVQFGGCLDFNEAQFHNKIDFRDAEFDSLSIADFSLAEIKDTVFVGKPKSSELQSLDFKRAILLDAGIDTIKTYSSKNAPKIFHLKYYKYGSPDSVKKIIKSPGAKIVLYGPVDLKMQLEKFKFITLYYKLDYYSKKDIISTLKQVSFKGNEYQKERFELDYIFAKSTMYQKQSPNYKKYSAFNPICWGQFLYNITMGLGYRPFRLAWWVLGLIVSFAIFYFFKLRDSIDGYILKKFEIKEASGTNRKNNVDDIRHISHTESLINCFYFSTMLLFTFRLKGEILTFFNLKEKRYIVGEYLLGLLIYIAFLTLAKSGSILHNLRSLFVG